MQRAAALFPPAPHAASNGNSLRDDLGQRDTLVKLLNIPTELPMCGVINLRAHTVSCAPLRAAAAARCCGAEGDGTPRQTRLLIITQARRRTPCRVRIGSPVAVKRSPEDGRLWADSGSQTALQLPVRRLAESHFRRRDAIERETHSSSTCVSC